MLVIGGRLISKAGLASLYPQSKDAVRAEYNGGGIRLSLSYGRSSRFSGYKGQSNLQEYVEEIDGRRAKIVTFTSGGSEASRKFIAAVYFTDDRAEWRRHPQLVMTAIFQGEAEQAAAVKIFRSVRWLSPPAYQPI